MSADDRVRYPAKYVRQTGNSCCHGPPASV